MVKEDRAWLIVLLLMFFTISTYAEEDCVFQENAYLNFIKKYNATHKDADLQSDGKTLVVNRSNEKIVVKGGGCIHLGVEIELSTKQPYTERAFLKRVLNLSVEFGDWLINTKSLSASIENGKYQKIDNAYFINVDAMTVFEAAYDKQGKINISFYIN